VNHLLKCLTFAVNNQASILALLNAHHFSRSCDSSYMLTMTHELEELEVERRKRLDSIPETIRYGMIDCLASR
jgi:hypothetical protein